MFKLQWSLISPYTLRGKRRSPVPREACLLFPDKVRMTLSMLYIWRTFWWYSVWVILTLTSCIFYSWRELYFYSVVTLQKEFKISITKKSDIQDEQIHISEDSGTKEKRFYSLPILQPKMKTETQELCCQMLCLYRWYKLWRISGICVCMLI